MYTFKLYDSSNLRGQSRYTPFVWGGGAQKEKNEKLEIGGVLLCNFLLYGEGILLLPLLFLPSSLLVLSSFSFVFFIFNEISFLIEKRKGSYSLIFVPFCFPKPFDVNTKLILNVE